MKTKQHVLHVNYQNQTYEAWVTFKRMKRITFRMRESNILVSSPFKVPLNTIQSLLLKLMPKILKRYQPIPFQEGAFLWFGSWRRYDESFTKAHRNDLKWVKKALHAFAAPRVEHWCRQLGETIVLPKILIRSMTSRWGTYSRKTHRITLSSTLVAFHPKWIDAVIAHECVHIVHFDHSSRFYATLQQLLPTYEETHAKLKQGYPHANFD